MVIKWQKIHFAELNRDKEQFHLLNIFNHSLSHHAS